jgi:hypothetical protein
VLIFAAMIAVMAIRSIRFCMLREIVKFAGQMLLVLSIFRISRTLLPPSCLFVSSLITAAPKGGVEFFELHRPQPLDAIRLMIPE